MDREQARLFVRGFSQVRGQVVTHRDEAKFIAKAMAYSFEEMVRRMKDICRHPYYRRKVLHINGAFTYDRAIWPEEVQRWTAAVLREFDFLIDEYGSRSGFRQWAEWLKSEGYDVDTCLSFFQTKISVRLARCGYDWQGNNPLAPMQAMG